MPDRYRLITYRDPFLGHALTLGAMLEVQGTTRFVETPCIEAALRALVVLPSFGADDLTVAVSVLRSLRAATTFDLRTPAPTVYIEKPHDLHASIEDPAAWVREMLSGGRRHGDDPRAYEARIATCEALAVEREGAVSEVARLTARCDAASLAADVYSREVFAIALTLGVDVPADATCEATAVAARERARELLAATTVVCPACKGRGVVLYAREVEDGCDDCAATGRVSGVAEVARLREMLALSERYRDAWSAWRSKVLNDPALTLDTPEGSAAYHRLAGAIPTGAGALDRAARRALGPLWPGWQERAEAAYAALARIDAAAGVEPSVPGLDADRVCAMLGTNEQHLRALAWVVTDPDGVDDEGRETGAAAFVDLDVVRAALRAEGWTHDVARSIPSLDERWTRKGGCPLRIPVLASLPRGRVVHLAAHAVAEARFGWHPENAWRLIVAEWVLASESIAAHSVAG